jgi:hypothetical protein
MEPLFTGRDLLLIKALVYNPNLEPGYESIKGCLIWDDERPNNLTSDAYSNLCSLWGARALLHRGLTLADHPLDPDYCRDIWERALAQVPEWPGFKRLTLSAKDKDYYETTMKREIEFGEI